MNFFKKLQNNKQENVQGKEVETNQIADEKTSSYETEASLHTTTDEGMERTFLQEDITRSATFQAKVREEAKRLRMKEQILTEPHLNRLRDSLRLNETKMENIEENIRRSQKQMELLRRFNELSMELQVQKNELYDINKQLASSVHDRQALERFEEFENIQGSFQRLILLEAVRREMMARQSELTRNVDVYAKNLENAKKQLKALREETADASRMMKYSIEVVNEAQLIEGRLAYVAIENNTLNNRLHYLTSQRQVMDKELQERRMELKQMSEEIQALRTRRQSLAPHQRMAQHGELILERLMRFAEADAEQQKAQRTLTECRKKQSEADDMLGGIYTDYQQILQDIQALQDELSVHRDNIHGLDSYRLQERSMKLRLRKNMLINAKSLWNKIAQGYVMIEESMQRINALRLKLEPMPERIRSLSNEVAILRHTTHEKEYTLIVGKSQNVIQLRNDLQEGVSCTVCGARHHPYHSDTMLEQNMLISDMKMEYEALATELSVKDNRLKEEEMEYERLKATRNEAENTLITLRNLQNGFVQDWQMFNDLDITFSACDSTVNATARTAMLKQLIENIDKEVQESQKELDSFNFHQQRINTLNEMIASKEQKKNEIITRLNEVNTACQVMAGSVERAQTQKQVVRDAYSCMFETLDKMITIPDWMNIWNRSHEALNLNIQELSKECLTLNERIREKENQYELQKLQIQHMEQQFEQLLENITQVDDNCKLFVDRMREDEQKLTKLVGKQSAKALLQEAIQNAEAVMDRYHSQLEIELQVEGTQKDLEGRYMECKEASDLIAQRVAAERQAVDCWIQKYNANHPPVQYEELNEMFANEHDWNEIRTRIRDIQMNYLLTQARVTKLGSQIVTLQAEGSNFGTDTEALRNQLIAQIETLEQRRKETMMQIATISLQLNSHERAESLKKEGLMRENI